MKPHLTFNQRQSIKDQLYFQAWLIIVTVTGFGFFVAYDQNFFTLMLETDKSYLTALIFAVFLAASCHVAWNITAISARLRAAHAFLSNEIDAETLQKLIVETDKQPEERFSLSEFEDSPARFVSRYIADQKAATDRNQAAEDKDKNNLVLEVYADRLRGPVEIGWYIVDILIRLGLIGTIVGFILILQSLVGGPIPDTTEIQKLLVKMSGGMGTALFTTLAGLVTATILGLQYMVLSRSVEQLVAALIRINERTKL